MKRQIRGTNPMLFVMWVTLLLKLITCMKIKHFGSCEKLKARGPSAAHQVTLCGQRELF